MARTLERELADPDVARTLASCIREAGFRWSYPQFSANDADSVVAYSFGYRSATGAVNPNTGYPMAKKHLNPARSTRCWPMRSTPSAGSDPCGSTRSGK